MKVDRDTARMWRRWFSQNLWLDLLSENAGQRISVLHSWLTQGTTLLGVIVNWEGLDRLVRSKVLLAHNSIAALTLIDPEDITDMATDGRRQAAINAIRSAHALASDVNICIEMLGVK